MIQNKNVNNGDDSQEISAHYEVNNIERTPLKNGDSEKQ